MARPTRRLFRSAYIAWPDRKKTVNFLIRPTNSLPPGTFAEHFLVFRLRKRLNVPVSTGKLWTCRAIASRPASRPTPTYDFREVNP